jgi:hypothetical protein
MVAITFMAKPFASAHDLLQIADAESQTIDTRGHQDIASCSRAAVARCSQRWASLGTAIPQGLGVGPRRLDQLLHFTFDLAWCWLEMRSDHRAGAN